MACCAATGVLALAYAACLHVCMHVAAARLSQAERSKQVPGRRGRVVTCRETLVLVQGLLCYTEKAGTGAAVWGEGIDECRTGHVASVRAGGRRCCICMACVDLVHRDGGVCRMGTLMHSGAAVLRL